MSVEVCWQSVFAAQAFMFLAAVIMSTGDRIAIGKNEAAY